MCWFPPISATPRKKPLAYARAFAEDYGAKIYISHAVNPAPPIFMPMEPIPIDLDAEWQDAQVQLNRFAANNLKDTLHEAILGRGETWNVIDDIIRQHSIDLIILGTRGKHGIKKLLFGSGAEKIFRHADCPVLTVGPNVEAPTGDVAAFRHIVSLPISLLDRCKLFRTLFLWQKRTKRP